MAINVSLGGEQPIVKQAPDKFEWIIVIGILFAVMAVAQTKTIAGRQAAAIGLYILVGAVFTDVALWIGVIGLFAVGFTGGFVALANWIQALLGGGSQLTIKPTGYASLPPPTGLTGVTGYASLPPPTGLTGITPQTPQAPIIGG